MTNPSRDTIYAHATDEVQRFEFNDAVSRVFADMIRRSVPGYETVLATTGVLVSEVAERGSLVYDLGCSLGEAASAVLAACGSESPELVLIDASEPMIARCRERFRLRPEVNCVSGDLLGFDYQAAAACILNYTLQFIASGERTRLLARLNECLVPGGVLVLSEKIRLEPAEADARAIQRHHGFKRLMGYSEGEIERKREALDEVLVPDTLSTLEARLREAGFARIHVWFTCLNWVSLAAYKPDVGPLDTYKQDA